MTSQWNKMSSARLSLSGVLLLAVLLGASAIAWADKHDDGKKQQSPSFKVSEIKPGFFLLQGKGGNILAFKGEQGLLVIDSDYAEMSEALQQALKGIGGEVKYLINTHWHGDHTQGNKALGKTAHHIVAHQNVFERLNSRQETPLFKMVSEPYPNHALPDITYEQRMMLRFNGDTIRVNHYPNGHTDGDSVVWFENANLVHMGDHLFNGFYPFVDVNAQGSVRGMAANIDHALNLINDDTTIVPGHGPMATREDLVAFRDMLLGTAEEVEAMMSEDKTLEQMQAQGLSSQWDEWEDGFLAEKVWIQIVHSSLQQSE